MGSPGDLPRVGLAPLILVVGPSGAGKDSLMDGACARLAAQGRFHFARRVVTRPADAGAEDHDSVTPGQFARMDAAGAFLLSWAAHGLGYGVLRSVDDQRHNGVAVVANVSRQVVDHARCRHAPVGVVVVTAPPAILAQRLASRGREDAEDIRHRLERAATPLPEGEDVVVVANDTNLSVGIDRFVAALCRLHHPVG